jgi:hypothetical protein
MGRPRTRHSRARNRFIAWRLSTPKAFGVPVVMLKSHGSGRFGSGVLPALQKFKVKWLDLPFVTLANSFLGERVGKEGNKNSNSNFS